MPFREKVTRDDLTCRLIFVSISVFLERQAFPIYMHMYSKRILGKDIHLHRRKLLCCNNLISNSHPRHKLCRNAKWSIRRLLINPSRNGNEHHVSRTGIERDRNLVDTCMTFAYRHGAALTRLCLATSRVHDLLVLHSVHVSPQAIRFVFEFLACFSPTRATCHRTGISAKPYPRHSRNRIILEIPLGMYSRRLLQDRFKRPLSLSRI